MFALGLGHETASMLAVLAAFFGGSALGSLLLDTKIAPSRAPGRWYAGLEAVAGVWGITLSFFPW